MFIEDYFNATDIKLSRNQDNVVYLLLILSRFLYAIKTKFLNYSLKAEIAILKNYVKIEY